MDRRKFLKSAILGGSAVVYAAAGLPRAQAQPMWDDGEWHFIVYQRHSAVTRMFVDGVEVDAIEANRFATRGTMVTCLPNDDDGTWSAVIKFPLKKDIDHILQEHSTANYAYWPRVLEPNEIRRLAREACRALAPPGSI